MSAIDDTRLGGRSRASKLQLLSFSLGLIVLAGLWLGPLVPMSRTAFSPHMMLHLGVVVVASPLIACGLAHYLRGPKSFKDALSWCLLAALFEMVAVWGWHIPLLHDAAGPSDALFVLEQASFLLAGLGMWTAAFAARARRVVGAAAIALFFTFTHMTMFGLVLTLAPHLIYDPNLCRGAFGLDRLDDQHFGGVLMAVGGGLPYLIGTGWALAHLFRTTRFDA
jgi:putative membrane protein